MIRSNENFNVIVRRVISKKKTLGRLTSDEMLRINLAINAMPRKPLNEKSAKEALAEQFELLRKQGKKAFNKYIIILQHMAEISNYLVAFEISIRKL